MSSPSRKRTLRKQDRRLRARRRIRGRIAGTPERPRLSVRKSLRYIYAQVINDQTGETLASASSLEADLRKELDGKSGNKAAAKLVGEKLAERAKEKGVETVVFDRGANVYHGKIKELAEGARSGGLQF